MVRGWATSPLGPSTAGACATKRSSDVAAMTSFRRTPPPQVHLSAPGAEQPTPSSARASKPPVRLPKARMSKVSPFSSVKSPVSSIPRPPLRLALPLIASAPYWPVASPAKSRPSAPAAVWVKLPVMARGRQRRDLQRTLVDHGSLAAVDLDVVAEHSIAAGEGEVPVADRDRAAGPGPEGRCPRRR